MMVMMMSKYRCIGAGVDNDYDDDYHDADDDGDDDGDDDQVRCLRS